MADKSSLYDVIAVLIPGRFLLWARPRFSGVGAEGIPSAGGVGETVELIVVGDLTGLLRQGISQRLLKPPLLWWRGGLPSARWLLPDDERLSAEHEQDLAKCTERRFGTTLALDARTWTQLTRESHACREAWLRALLPAGQGAIAWE